MVILKMLHKQLDMPQVSIDRLIETLQDIKLGKLTSNYYKPMFQRTAITDRLQDNHCDRILFTKIALFKWLDEPFSPHPDHDNFDYRD